MSYAGDDEPASEGHGPSNNGLPVGLADRRDEDGATFDRKPGAIEREKPGRGGYVPAKKGATDERW